MGVKVREVPAGSGRWYIYIDWKGKRKAKYVGKEKAAHEAATKIQAKLVLNEYSMAPDPPEKAVPTFSAYREQWMRTYAAVHCKPSTYREYESVFKNHLADFDSKPIDEISRNDIKELIARKLQEEPRPETQPGKKRSRGTMRNILAPLREMLNHAVDDGTIASNPANRAGRFIKETTGKANRSKIDPLSREEVATLLSTSQKFGHDAHTLLLCAARTGMRMGELFGLQWGDLDFNGRFIEVRRSIVRGHEGTPKSGYLRRIDMSNQLSEALKELRRRRKILFFNVRVEAERLQGEGQEEKDIVRALSLNHSQHPDLIRTILRTKGEETAWVFINDEGQPLDHHNFRKRVFHQVIEQSGVRRVRFHDLRHTFASLLLQQGESLAYVKEQMGHHSIQVTVDIYGHLIPGSNRQAVDRLDDKAKRTKRSRPQTSANQTQTTPRLRVAAVRKL